MTAVLNELVLENLVVGYFDTLSPIPMRHEMDKNNSSYLNHKHVVLTTDE
ncbi:Uncharacterised protein [Chlamydia trachomatis]|nr:Uncharacterised protein [Chlamydia trachomatis]